MLWHTSCDTHRHMPCGEASVAIFNRPIMSYATEKLTLGGRRT
jgi:hypothetical protein